MKLLNYDLIKSNIICLTSLIVIMCGCAVTDTPKYQMTDGYYKSGSFRNQARKVYIDNSEDTIFVYTINRHTSGPDTISGKHTFPQVSSRVQIESSYFREASFDIDFLTIPFKYRGSVAGVPRQFNTNLNGAVYVGYRNDLYQLSFLKNPLNKYHRQTQHYGISFGLFTGLGGTAMNPSVTNNSITSEYDGVVWSKGVAGIIGINNFTLGLALGFDTLLDKNKSFWIYQKKPWLGLAFGLNLN